MGGVERRSSPPGGVVPEDRMGDEPVKAPSAHQRAKLLASTCRLEVAPYDRVKAGVPIPLMPVARRGRTREAVGSAIGKVALPPVAGQNSMRVCSQPGDAAIANRSAHRPHRALRIAGDARALRPRSCLRSWSSASNTRSQLIDLASAAAALTSTRVARARSTARAQSTRSL